jgi:hypothetical protein
LLLSLATVALGAIVATSARVAAAVRAKHTAPSMAIAKTSVVIAHQDQHHHHQVQRLSFNSVLGMVVMLHAEKHREKQQIKLVQCGRTIVHKLIPPTVKMLYVQRVVVNFLITAAVVRMSILPIPIVTSLPQ